MCWLLQVALVGKGLTFDSGGYNLKVQGGIETMKCDMGGAGAILGAARTLAQLQPAGVEVRAASCHVCTPSIPVRACCISSPEGFKCDFERIHSRVGLRVCMLSGGTACT